MQDKKLWSDELRNLINSLSSATNQKILVDQTWIKKEENLPGSSFFSHDRRVNQSSHFPCISCIPLCLDHSAHWVTSPLSLYAPHSLLLLLLALSPSLYHSISLSFTSSLPLIDPYSFQGFPSALLLPIAPLITACCIADRRDTSCALSLFSLTISLSHPPLQLSFSHNFTFHTLWHSDSETYAIQLQLQYARALKTHFVYISRTIPLQFLLLYLYLSFSLTCFQMQAIQG